MWFIGVEVEQETSAPPPKKNPGSAPAVQGENKGKKKKKRERRVVFSPVFFSSPIFWPRYLNAWNRLVTKELRRLRLS